MKQQELDRLKEQAPRGSWEEYILTETEYKDPLRLAQMSSAEAEAWLADKVEACHDWMSDNRDQYPASGAEEVLRQQLTEEIERSETAISDDAASDYEMKRMDGKTLENIAASLRRKMKAGKYPLREESLEIDKILDKATSGQKLQQAEVDYLYDNLPGWMLGDLHV